MSIELLILLFTGFSILSAVLDAASDAIRDNGSVNHFIEFLQVLNTVLDGVLLGIIVAQNHYYGLKTSIILFFLIMYFMYFLALRKILLYCLTIGCLCPLLLV